MRMPCARASVGLCEACNGTSMALLMQSLCASVVACILRTSTTRTNVCASLALLAYAFVSTRCTVVACCNYSGKRVANSITWCSTQNPGDARCQDATGALRLFLGTSIAIQVSLLSGAVWGLSRWRALHVRGARAPDPVIQNAPAAQASHSVV